VTRLRIGTWNMEGRWSAPHRAMVLDLACDVWLLTEVSKQANVPLNIHRSSGPMPDGRSWAAIGSRHPLTPMADPHTASAAARVGGITYCSSVLPWRSSGSAEPWGAGTAGTRTSRALSTLDRQIPRTRLVWGGDLNHSVHGTEVAGSLDGRGLIAEFVADRKLVMATAGLPHRLEGVGTIDHVAVPSAWSIVSASRVDATGLSDHDVYVVEVSRDDYTPQQTPARG
jgi:hypothetical protein